MVFKLGVTQVNTQTYVSAINSYYFQAVVYCLEFNQVRNKPSGKYNFSQNKIRKIKAFFSNAALSNDGLSAEVIRKKQLNF